MVIGGHKDDQISAAPILNWYFEIFQDVIATPDSHLLIIGYGFADEHINRAIAHAIAESDSKFSVLGPGEMAGLVALLEHCEGGDVLLSGLEYHFPYTLVEVFPKHAGQPTQLWLDIMEKAFGFAIDPRYR